MAHKTLRIRGVIVVGSRKQNGTPIADEIQEKKLTLQELMVSRLVITGVELLAVLKRTQ